MHFWRLRGWILGSHYQLKWSVCRSQEICSYVGLNHPKTFNRLCVFLGITRYHRKFVTKYGKFVSPFTSILKYIYFLLREFIEKFFSTLKDVMWTTLVLEVPHFTNIFLSECNSIGKGLGIVVMQEGNHLAFISK